MAENKPLRFRAAPAVHMAWVTLQTRGVDVGEMLSKHLVEQAAADTEIMRHAQALGLSPRRHELWNQDAVVILFATNGAGAPPVRDGRRVVCSFTRDNYRGTWRASAVEIFNGYESVARDGALIPAGLPVHKWIGYAEATLPSRLP